MRLRNQAARCDVIVKARGVIRRLKDFNSRRVRPFDFTGDTEQTNLKASRSNLRAVTEV